MKIAFKLTLLTAMVFFLNYNTANAQYTPARKKTTSKSKSDKYFDESGDISQHLQYGLHFSPGLNFSGSYFNFRLDPSVGYKINKWSMAGLTGGINYTYERFSSNVTNYTLNLVNTSYGVYGRVIPIPSFPQLYIHGDFKSATYARAQVDGNGNPYLDPNNPTKLLSEKQTKPELNLGLAYKTGTGSAWGLELLLLYNVLNDANYYVGPFDFKIGATYNF